MFFCGNYFIIKTNTFSPLHRRKHTFDEITVMELQTAHACTHARLHTCTHTHCGYKMFTHTPVKILLVSIMFSVFTEL